MPADLLSQIGGMEHQLGAVRELARKQAIMQLELLRRQTEIQEQAAASSARETVLKNDLEALNIRVQELTRERDTLLEARGVLEERAATLSTQAEAALLDAESLRATRQQLEERERSLETVGEQLNLLTAELERQTSIVSARDRALAEVGTELERLRSSQIATAPRGGTETLPGQHASLHEVLVENQALWLLELERGAELEKARAQAQARLELALKESHEGQAERAELESLVEALKDRLRGAISRTREIEAAPHPSAEVNDSARLSRRRARLSQYKALLRGQAIKVRRAGEALTKRYEQVEQVLAMRADLAAARQRVIEAERRAHRRSALPQTVAPLAGIVVTVGLIVALSWAIAREMAPSKYAATAVLKAESRERPLNSDELSEWQKLHEGLISDPRVHESLAERFKRQGILALASPGDVAELARGDMSVESGADGELKLRLEGVGADATSRTLEIFSNGLTNYVNSGSLNRVDGASTVIAQAASAGDSPIDSIRLRYAAAIASGSVIACLGFGGLIWRRLAQAKTAFETDAQLTSVLDRTSMIEDQADDQFDPRDGSTRA